MPFGDAGIGRGASPMGRGPSRCGQGSEGVRAVSETGNNGFMRKPIFKTVLSSAIFGLSGITKDASGNPIAGATVKLFADGSNAFLFQTISDGSGFFTFVGIGVPSVFLVAYLDGAPEVGGVSIHNLSPIVVG